MLTFSRNLNLLIEDDLSTFLHEVTNSGYSLPISNEDELKKVIQSGRKVLPDSAFEISGGMTPIDVRPKGAVVYNFLEDILPIIYLLYTLKGNSDFMAKVKANLANATQFDDTLFELKCLSYFYKNGFEFNYEPSIISGNSEKKPDFLLNKDAIEFFVECKQIRVADSMASKQFNDNCKYLSGHFTDMAVQKLFDTKLRLEINFKRSPSQKDLQELVKQINQLFGNNSLEQLSLQHIGDSVEYLIVQKCKAGQFPVRLIRHTEMQISAVPRGLSPDPSKPLDEEITIYASDLTKKIRRTLSKRISKAKHQLPDDKQGIIVVGKIGETILANYGEAMMRRMNSREYGNIIALVADPFEGFRTWYKTAHRESLATLFNGFQQENPFSSNKL